jgi:hypothetical protein
MSFFVMNSASYLFGMGIEAFEVRHTVSCRAQGDKLEK